MAAVLGMPLAPRVQMEVALTTEPQNDEVLYEPSPVQQEAHNCPANWVLYGGTAGPGKTLWLRWDPFQTQIFDEHERWLQARREGKEYHSVGWALHVREHMNQLVQTIEYVKRVSKKVDPGSRWWAQDKMVEFTSGYKFQFGHLEHEDSWESYDTNEYTHLAMDEAVRLHESQFMGLQSRVRTSDPILAKKLRVALATNPDAPARGRWVKRIFVDPAPEGRKLLRQTFTRFDGTQGESTAMYIPAYLKDNPNAEFRRQYEDKLRTLPRHLMLARLMCDWNVVEGAFFEYEWMPSHHVVEPFKIPENWTKFRVLDWGYKCACVIKYFAVNEDGDLVCFRELTFNHGVPPQQRKDSQLVAIAIRNVEKEMGLWDVNRNCSKITGPADYQIREERDGGWTIEDRMAQEGVFWVPCHKNRSAGTAEFLRRLKDIPTNEHSRPGITYFNTCKHTIRTIPQIPVSSNDPEVPEDGGDDHWYDCDMYACMYRTASASSTKVKPKEEWEQNDMDAARARRTSKRWGYGS